VVRAAREPGLNWSQRPPVTTGSGTGAANDTELAAVAAGPRDAFVKARELRYQADVAKLDLVFQLLLPTVAPFGQLRPASTFV